MNMSEFLGSHIGEDPQNLIDEVNNIFEITQVTLNDWVDLEFYQFKDVDLVYLVERKQGQM